MSSSSKNLRYFSQRYPRNKNVPISKSFYLCGDEKYQKVEEIISDSTHKIYLFSNSKNEKWSVVKEYFCESKELHPMLVVASHEIYIFNKLYGEGNLNILKVNGVCIVQSVLPYIKGNTLRNVIKEFKTSKEVLNTASSLSVSLRTLHTSNKIAHNDLHEENIIIGEDRQCRYIDFDLSVIADAKNEKTFNEARKIDILYLIRIFKKFLKFDFIEFSLKTCLEDLINKVTLELEKEDYCLDKILNYIIKKIDLLAIIENPPISSSKFAYFPPKSSAPLHEDEDTSKKNKKQKILHHNNH